MSNMSLPYRMNVFVDDHRKVMVLRVIGPMPGDEYADRLEQFSSIFPLHAYREALARLGRAV